ncbi:CocE/NonD family hydrolase [Mesorhizobium sp. M0894]|uniref:CocE/NonD family hydrolase n=1 Tax=unclassified Mesorhizobium TaxID=325217 RepID=UPI003337C9F2
MTKVIENEWIQMWDGRNLAARIWLPGFGGAAPALFEYLPYRKRDGTAGRDETTHRVFAEAGYACVRVDIAGTGDSFDDEYSKQELSDGETVLAWIAAQEWCDGNVGMVGISWGSFNGLQLAYRRPPALKAVISIASTVNRYADDIHFMDGCLLSDNVNWATQLCAYLARPADPQLREDWREDWIARLANVPFSAVDWLLHPTRDDFWKHGSLCEDWSRIEAPVLAITGWADAYVNAPPALASNLRVPCKAMIGPWEHSYPHLSRLDPADFHSEAIRWFDRWLKGDRNGAEDPPAYRVYMQEHFNPSKEYGPRVGRWVAEQSWPSAHVNDRILFLGSDVLKDNATVGTVAVSSPAHIGQAGGYYCPGMRIDNELAEYVRRLRPEDQSASRNDRRQRCSDALRHPSQRSSIGPFRKPVEFHLQTSPVAGCDPNRTQHELRPSILLPSPQGARHRGPGRNRGVRKRMVRNHSARAALICPRKEMMNFRADQGSLGYLKLGPSGPGVSSTLLSVPWPPVMHTIGQPDCELDIARKQHNAVIGPKPSQEGQ